MTSIPSLPAFPAPRRLHSRHVHSVVIRRREDDGFDVEETRHGETILSDVENPDSEKTNSKTLSLMNNFDQLSSTFQCHSFIA